MKIDDIQGTKARVRHPTRPNGDNQYTYLDYRDVTDVDFKTKRSTNPLMPEYVHREEDGTKCTIGQVPGSLPNVLPPARQDQEFVATSLKTKDILGCATSTKGIGSFHTRPRKDVKQTNITSDIIGCAPDSLKKAPVTIRQTHPLDPDYQMPGRLELSNINHAFGKRNAVQQAILDKHVARGDNRQFMGTGASTLKAAAQASLEGSKLYSASRQESMKSAKEVADLPADVVPNRSSKAVSEAAASHKS